MQIYNLLKDKKGITVIHKRSGTVATLHAVTKPSPWARDIKRITVAYTTNGGYKKYVEWNVTNISIIE